MSEELHTLNRLLEKLQDVNSFYPATQQFLRLRGLDHITELGEDGRQELLSHLRSLLKRTIQ